MSKLPPLPEHNREFLCTKCGSRECQGDIKDPHPHCFKCGYLGVSSDVGYADAQMSEYGQLCRNQALDEAAQVCRSMQNGWPSDQHIECAKAIEALK